MAEGSIDISTEDTTCASGDAETEPSHGLICQICEENGDHLKAEGYCQDCVVYLCKPCVKYHKRLPVSRDHTLLSEDDMPQNADQVPLSPPDVCTDKCTEHGDVVKYYCNDHGQFGCTVCITLYHRNNCDIDYIPKISKDVVQGEEYTDLMTKVNVLIDRSASLENDSVIDQNQTDQLETKLLEDIDKYRTEINQLLDRIVCNIKAKTDKMRKNNQEHVINMSEKSKRAKEGLHAMRDNFETLVNTKQFCKLFREIKNAKSTMTEIEKGLVEIDNRGITQYELTWRNILCLLDTVEVKLNEPSQFTCAHIGAIRVKSDKGSRLCVIAGMVMMPEYNDKLVMVDRNKENYSIKVVDRSKKILTTELRLSSFPGDIASFQTNKLAVTFPANKISVLQWDNDRESLSIDTEFPTTGVGWGITGLQDNLVVTYTKPGKVEIIDHTGKTIQTFSKDQNGDDLFSCLSYVAVSADGQSIYVTDEDEHTVTCLGLDGKVKAIYKDNELVTPGGIYVDSFGTVFVCGYGSHNIHVLTPDLRKVKVLLQESDGIYCPYSLYLCEDTDQLYVGMCVNNDIKVYQLTRYNGYNTV